MREQFIKFFIIMFLYNFVLLYLMYRYKNSVGTEISSRSLPELRMKAARYLRSCSAIDTVDILSDRQGYMGNVHKPANTDYCVWSPANGKRLEYAGQVYLGEKQSWINDDGTLGERVEGLIQPYEGARRRRS